MLNLSFNLKDPQTDKESSELKETPIICVVRFKAQRLKYYTGEKINPKYWDYRKDSKKYQRAKPSFTEARELNARLESILTAIKNVFRKYQNENHNSIPTIDTLKNLLDIEFERSQQSAKTFIGFLEEIIKLSKSGVRTNPKTGKPISVNTIKTYSTTLKHLKAFQLFKNKQIDFNTIDLDFYNDYREFLMDGKKFKRTNAKDEGRKMDFEPLNLSTNAIAKHFQIIKLVMNEAVDRKLTDNIAYKSSRFAVIRENSDSIYLSESEIEEMEKLDLSSNKRLDKVRDLFLAGYYTGQRFSDYSVFDFTKTTVDDDGDQFLELTQVKTGTTIQIPIHPNLKRILFKYNGNLPRPYANQKMNEYLKELGEAMPCLQSKVEIDLPTKGNLKASTTLPKFKLLTTHTARRSFATNHYLAGWGIYTIMAITGHKTEKSFKKYIKLSPKEHAKVAHAEWKKRSNVLKAV
jgi:integrase